MSIAGPPSDADIKHMKCSDVMTPLLNAYIGRIRKAYASQQQQQQVAAASPEQQQQPGISPVLAAKFKGASPTLLLMLQRLLSFDPEFRISAGDAFVQLASTPLASAPSSLSAVHAAASSSSPHPPRLLKHPIDAAVDGGHTGDLLLLPVFVIATDGVTVCAAALKTVNDIMRHRGKLDLDSRKTPREQLEECIKLLTSEIADILNL